MPKVDCIFCKIAAGELQSVRLYEDNEFLAFLDIHPVSAGHTLVIPKAHYDRFVTMPVELVGKLYQLVHKLAPGIALAMGTDAFNLGLNSGPAAGQVVFHTHVHIIPRKMKDGLVMWGPKDYTGSQIDEVGKRIRTALKPVAMV